MSQKYQYNIQSSSLAWLWVSYFCLGKGFQKTFLLRFQDLRSLGGYRGPRSWGPRSLGGSLNFFCTSKRRWEMAPNIIIGRIYVLRKNSVKKYQMLAEGFRDPRSSYGLEFVPKHQLTTSDTPLPHTLPPCHSPAAGAAGKMLIIIRKHTSWQLFCTKKTIDPIPS